MAESIKVIETTVQRSADQMSTEELTIFVQQMAETAGAETGTQRHFDSFLAMKIDELLRRHLVARPSIPELLVRAIVSLARAIRAVELGTPLVALEYLPPINIYAIATLAAAVAASVKRETKSGAAAPERKPDFRRRFVRQTKKIVRHVVDGALQIRFDGRTIADTGKRTVVVAENEEVNIVGLTINPPGSIDIRAVNRRAPGKLRLAQELQVTALAPLDPRVILRHIIPPLGPQPPSHYISAAEELAAAFDYLAAIFTAPRHGVLYRMELGAATTPVTISEFHSAEESGIIAATLPAEFGKAATVEGALRRLESIHPIVFSTWWRDSLMSDLELAGLVHIFVAAIAKGIDSDAAVAMITRRLELKALDELAARVKYNLMVAKNQVSRYLIIIARKMPRLLPRLEREIALHPGLAANPAGVLALLTAPEAKSVTLEYEAAEAAAEALLNNRCPHVAVVRRLRRALDLGSIRRELDQLESFIAQPSRAAKKKHDGGMVGCNSCNFDVICPHVLELYRAESRGASYAETKAALTPFIDQRAIRGDFFCRVCGEFITEEVEMGGLEGMGAGPMDDELRKLIWGEVIQLLTAVTRVGDGKLVDLGKLTSGIRDAIYPQVAAAEKRILKSKTNTADEIKSRKRLYIAIYAIAYIVYMAHRTATGDTDSPAVSFTGLALRPNKLLSQLISHARGIIMTRKNVIIREIPGMTAEQVAAIIIEAYQEIITSGTGASTEEDTRAGDRDDTEDIELDGIYRYIAMINALDRAGAFRRGAKKGGAARKKRPDRKNETRADRKRQPDDHGRRPIDHSPRAAKILIDPEDVLGPPQPKKGKKDAADGGIAMMYQHRRMPQFDGVATKQSLPPLDVAAPPPPSSQLHAESDRIVAESYRAFDAQLAAPLGAPRFISVTEEGATVILAQPHSDIQQQWLAVVEDEERLVKYRAMAAALSYYHTRYRSSRAWNRKDPLPPLGRSFDEDGTPHKWSIFVVAADGKGAATSPPEELTAAQIFKLTTAGKWDRHIIDKKCEVCGELQSTAPALDAARIADSLAARARIDNFFRFYQNRCPEGDLHTDLIEKNVCGKCGYKVALSSDDGGRDRLAYYRKYRATYDRERAAFAPPMPPRIEPEPLRYDNSWAKQYARWSFKDEVILDLASKLDINARLLLALGAMERVEYADIVSGIFIPPVEEVRKSTRVYKIDAWIKQLITEWNQVRFFGRLIKPAAELVALIDASGIPRQNIGALATSLGDPRDDFDARAEWFQRNKKPREIVQFYIQSFCEICLRIWDGIGGDGNIPDAAAHSATLTLAATEKLRRDFVRYIVAKILEAERMVTAPGYFSWSLLYGDRSSDTKPYDTNYDRDVETTGDEDDERDDDFGNTADPFSTDAFDMEDADDEGGIIKAGENYGLD